MVKGNSVDVAVGVVVCVAATRLRLCYHASRERNRTYLRVNYLSKQSRTPTYAVTRWAMLNAALCRLLQNYRLFHSPL